MNFVYYRKPLIRKVQIQVLAVSEGMVCSSRECGIVMHPAGEVWMLPNIAGFVGEMEFPEQENM